MAKTTALQEAYNENKRLQSIIEQLERRLNVVSLDTYKELEENHERVVEGSRQSHKKIAELEKKIRQLTDEIFFLKRELETIKSQTKVKIHNERGAGKKPTIADETKKLIHELRSENTIAQIQSKLTEQGIKISVGAIHKIIAKR